VIPFFAYPHFGFAPSLRYGSGCEYAVREESFMVLELQAGDPGGKTGMIQFHDAGKKL